MRRFDEIELDSVPLGGIEEPAAVESPASDEASRVRRLFALLTDLSLFAALAFALRPLLRDSDSVLGIVALSGFVLVLSYYYFAGCWLLWGKTVGGAIFDVRVAAVDETMSLKQASLRWLALLLSLLTGGIALLPAILPWRRSLPDVMSDTRCLTVS
jgi:uncharacterized RDD family membrane protein YckC